MTINFFLIAESGALEQQALLLTESIRTFGGRYANSKITILQPRRNRPISREGRLKFQAHQADVVELSIESPYPEYGPSYKVLACAEYERRATSPYLVFMDSDTLVLSEPDLDLQGADVAVRPVDVKGMCTTGTDDPNDAYWRNFSVLCGVDYTQIPWIQTTVDKARVRASYNGGLTVVKTELGLFEKSADFFLSSLRENLIPWPKRTGTFPAGSETVSAKGGMMWGSSQASLSIAITSLGLSVRILPLSVNFPLHFYKELLPEMKTGACLQVSHIHYHHLLRSPSSEIPNFKGQNWFPAKAIEWLRARSGAVINWA